MSADRAKKTAIVLAAIAAVALIAIPTALAAFTSHTENPGNTVTAVPDFTAPAITATVVAKTQGGVTGFVHKGGTYFVYANVSADTGNPASGLAAVKANAAELTSGQTAATMTAGSFTAGGVSYNYRSSELTANAAVEGSKNYSVTATDTATNAGTANGTATVDNVAPTATDIQTTNVGGGTNGLAELGDKIVYTYSEPIEPESVLAGWNGTASNVVVRLVDNGLLALPAGNDEVVIYNAANSAQLPLGAINIGRSDYVSGLLGGSVYYGATGTASAMAMSGNTITVTLGTYSAESILVARGTAAGTGTMVWTPVATPFDRAANVMSTTPATESGTVDKDF
ncbi:MAG TPA: hypothetical protein VJL81_05270 [Solirubrobacterales bacterium]|nr:hypothetical protein [Solirubrobacterales bacterium]